MSNSREIIGYTESVCPVCLKTVPAERVKTGSEVFLNKTCREHGFFSTVIWRGEPSFASWYQPTSVEAPQVTQTAVQRGCPHDCGLCPGHRRQSCCVLLEVTRRCNLKCPVCYADAGKEDHPDLSVETLRERLQALWRAAGDCHILLSGGEPTVRDDLPQIITEARAIGFTFFQLNTNGIRLAEEPAYLEKLQAAGLSTVFLQFDGLHDEVYEKIRGRRLMEMKTRAIANCAQCRMGVVLVPTLVPAINADAIGEIIRYAMDSMPTVRGVHFQPVSYFGRNSVTPTDDQRMTLPEVLAAIETQTVGRMKAEHFVPTGCEHVLCSFHGDFLVHPDGSLKPLSLKDEGGCCGANGANGASVQKSRDFVKNRWKLGKAKEGCCGQSGSVHADWDAVLEQMKTRRISISCMAFQDAYNLDLERLRDCCLHIVDRDRIVPFCAYNLTDETGRSLYRR